MLFTPSSPFYDPFVENCTSSMEMPGQECKQEFNLSATSPHNSSSATQSQESGHKTGLLSQEHGSKTGLLSQDSGHNQGHFDPDAKPFQPCPSDAGVSFAPEWQVVAAEFGGKAVAVLVDPQTFQVNVCTSPAFNSKCVHPGLSCLDWDSVVFDPDMCCTEGTRETSLASQSPLPGSFDTFHDSGYENIAHDSGYENMTDNSSEVSAEIFGGHGGDYYPPNPATYYQPIEVYTPRDGLEQVGMLAPAPTSPLVQYVPWVTNTEPEMSPVDHTHTITSGMSNISLEQAQDKASLGEVFTGAEKRDDSKDEQIKEAFKKKVLTNIKASEEEKEYEEKKKRRAFKKQILDNLKNTN